MRLLIGLEALRSCAYDLKYYHKAQGFVYRLLEGTPYSALHDGKSYKFFCFSNVLPPMDVQEGERRTLMISSPDMHFVRTVKEKLELTDGRVNIGEMSFRIADMKILDTKVGSSCSLITGTPIIIRIPREKYSDYGIDAKYDYAYWKPQHSFEAFLKQLLENVYKKYEEFYKAKVEREPLFQQFMFKKHVCNHIIMDGIERKVFGSVWEFGFDYLTEGQQNILQFAVDAGFGEMNSLGFGFMNMVSKC